MHSTRSFLLTFNYFFLICAILFGEVEQDFECGNNNLDIIPQQIINRSSTEPRERTEYNIDLALHVIYGKYDQTDITVSISVNQHYNNASFVVYDIFTKHWVMDDIINFTEPNQTIEVTILDIAGPHYIQAYGPDENTIITAIVTNSNGDILSSWNSDDYINQQGVTSSASVFYIFDTGEGVTDVGNIAESELISAIDRLNNNMQFSQISFSIDTINRVHNNNWAIGMDIGAQTYESVPALSIEPTEKLNIFSIIGFGHNLGLGGVGIFPWYLDTWDSVYYRATVKSFYYTDQALSESRSHVFDHEVGHALGLLHTFNYGCGSSQHGDYVDDTPTHAGANWGCADGTDSCPDDPGLDPVDNLMNYVYSTECPMSPFTPGQGIRALWAINTWVPTLIDTIPPGIWYISIDGSDETGDGSESNPFSSIQRGLNISSDNDTIMVLPGIYTEWIHWPEKSGLKLIGSGSGSSFIDGDSIINEPGTTMIYFPDTESGVIDTTTLISGFTIQNGSKGISCHNSSPKITDCVIKSNVSRNAGGGIALWDSSNAVLENVIISENISSWRWPPGPGADNNGQGGGVSIINSSPTFRNVEITENISKFIGGGISVSNGAPTFINCLVFNNYAEQGGGVHSQGLSNIQFSDSKIFNNESGYWGGGIHFLGTPGFVDSVQVHLTNVDIYGNQAVLGGGIYLSDPIAINLAGCTIKENIAFNIGGGIAIENSGYDSGVITFDPINRNDIYSNLIVSESALSRGQGMDIFLENDFTMDVVVDTFTVLMPSDYYCNPIGNFNFDILNSVQGSLINSDVFVSADGDNNNDGLSLESSFKTIEYALSRIYADSLNTKTIHLEPGTYGPSTNGEQFPIIWPQFVNLSGSGIDQTIISVENLYKRGIIFNHISEVIIDSLTFQYGAGVELHNSSVIFNDIMFSSNFSFNGGAVHCNNSSSPAFNNVTFKNNVCEFDENNSWNEDSGEGGAVFIGNESTPSFNYCSFINNRAESFGGAVSVHYGYPSFNYCLFTENISDASGASIFIGNSQSDSINIKSSTFYHNQSLDSSGANIVTNWTELIITSSIVRASQPIEFYNDDPNINITFSNIDGGYEGEGNIDLDPLFCNPDSLDFNLTEESPCISAGQYGAHMGAFGVGCTSILFTDNTQIPDDYKLYQNFPNPFNPNTTIHYDLPKNSLVSITVYDMMGRVVKNLVNDMQTAGFKSIQWDGTNNRNQSISAGIYIYTLYYGNNIETKKMILLK